MTNRQKASRHERRCRHAVASQIGAELWWLLVYLSCYVVGLFRSSGHQVDGHRRPVVLICGLMGRSPSFFRMRRRLQAAGHPVYSPDFGFQIGHIGEKTRELEAFLVEHDLNDCYLIGHSMGGFIAAGLSDDALERVRHIITLGSGFLGPWSTYSMAFFTGVRMMTPGSPYRRSILERIRGLDNHTNIHTWFDEIAIPTSACRLHVEREFVTPHLGHIQLVMSDCSIRLVQGILDELEVENGEDGSVSVG